MSRWLLDGQTEKLRKVFFSEEKKQKTFGWLSRFYPAAYATLQWLFGHFL
jgi:hypothetical protein